LTDIIILRPVDSVVPAPVAESAVLL